MLARRYQDERCQNRLAAASASFCVGVEPVGRWRPTAGTSAGRRPVGRDVAPVERLGRGPQRLRTEPERLALVGRQVDRPRRRPRRPSGS